MGNCKSNFKEISKIQPSKIKKHIVLKQIAGRTVQYEQIYYDFFDNLVVNGHKSNQSYLRNQKASNVSESTLRANPFVNERNQKVVATDNRSMVKDTLKFPHSAIGLITMQFNGVLHMGTGSLIGQNLVLTCAHNCYDQIYKKRAENIIFYPGLNGLEGNGFKVKNVYYHQDYEIDSKKQLDYAILQLEEFIGKYYGYFGVSFKGGIEKQVSICGYPMTVQTEGKQKKADNKQYWEKGKFVEDKVNRSLINYKISTSPGQSGSPIYIQQPGGYYIIGIHTHSLSGSQALFNSGIMLSDEIRNVFNRWVGKICGKLNLSGLSLGNEQASLIPKQYPLLISLNLSSNLITHMPKQLQNLVHLQTLVLSNNKLESFYFSLAKLVDLQSLQIINTNTDHLPSNIEKCSLLKVLRLSQNKFSTFPLEICLLQNIEELALSFNFIQTIPEQISKLKKLKNFDISMNQLKKLNESLWGVANLQTLDVSCNKIIQISQGCSQLKKLRVLNLAWNQLSDLGFKIGEIKSLKNLNCAKNKLNKIIFDGPQIILEQLNFSVNLIQNIQVPQKSSLRLKKINGSWNKLQTIPLFVCNSKDAQEINLQKNQIEEIPAEISSLSKLKNINLGKNRILYIPSQIKNLRCLDKLDLSQNKIQQIPVSLAEVRPSTQVALRGNPLNGKAKQVLQKMRKDQGFNKLIY